MSAPKDNPNWWISSPCDADNHRRCENHFGACECSCHRLEVLYFMAGFLTVAAATVALAWWITL